MNRIMPQRKLRVSSARIISIMPRASATRRRRRRLKRSVGIGASSCNYKDWIGTDVLVFWGSVAANNQPVSTKYMYAAKRKGTKIIVINPYHEPAMDGIGFLRFRNRRLFGTKMADDFYQVNIGGDIAFMNGVMKDWFEMEAEQPARRSTMSSCSEHANGYEQLRAHVAQQDWALLEQSSGLTRERMREFAAAAGACQVRRYSSGAWGLPSTASARTTSRRWRISRCCGAFSAASIAA